jgi:hypothetical protein
MNEPLDRSAAMGLLGSAISGLNRAVAFESQFWNSRTAVLSFRWR